MKKRDINEMTARIVSDLKEQLELRQEEYQTLGDEILKLEGQIKFYGEVEPAEKKRRKRTPPESPAQQ